MNIFNNTSYEITEDKIINYGNYLAKNMNNYKCFSLILIDNKQMQEYNKEFRDKDYPTDVLTFCDEEEDYLGDIYINIDKVIEQANLYKHSEKREFLFLLTHGFLHLLGYDHQTKEEEVEMFSLQEKLLNEYNVIRS